MGIRRFFGSVGVDANAASRLRRGKSSWSGSSSVVKTGHTLTSTSSSSSSDAARASATSTSLSSIAPLVSLPRSASTPIAAARPTPRVRVSSSARAISSTNTDRETQTVISHKKKIVDDVSEPIIDRYFAENESVAGARGGRGVAGSTRSSFQQRLLFINTLIEHCFVECLT
jgi:hypothetical protein